MLLAIEGAKTENRMVAFACWEGVKFDCNIQQVKKKQFDILYYGLCFSDAIVLLKIPLLRLQERSNIPISST